MGELIKSGEAAMKPERKACVLAMQAMGWTAKRDAKSKRPTWEFRRPDTGGLWDFVACKQENLSIKWLADIAMRYGDADALVRQVNSAKENWFANRFPRLADSHKEASND